MTSKVPIRHIVLDLDSTLTDSLRTIAVTRTALLEWLLELPGMDGTRLADEVASRLRADFHNPDVTRACASLAAWRSRATRPRLEALEEIERRYDAHLKLESTLLAGADAMLAYCAARGIGIAVWTNKKLPFARRHVHDLGLTGRILALYARASPVACRFDDANGRSRTQIAAVEESKRKPSSETLQRILRECGFEARFTICVGNNVESDGGSTVGTDVRFVQSAFGIPAADVEDMLFRLTRDRRLSYRAERERTRRSRVTHAAVIERDLSQLVALVEQEAGA